MVLKVKTWGFVSWLQQYIVIYEDIPCDFFILFVLCQPDLCKWHHLATLYDATFLKFPSSNVKPIQMHALSMLTSLFIGKWNTENFLLLEKIVWPIKLLTGFAYSVMWFFSLVCKCVNQYNVYTIDIHVYIST